MAFWQQKNTPAQNSEQKRILPVIGPSPRVWGKTARKCSFVLRWELLQNLSILFLSFKLAQSRSPATSEFLPHTTPFVNKKKAILPRFFKKKSAFFNFFCIFIFTKLKQSRIMTPSTDNNQTNTNTRHTAMTAETHKIYTAANLANLEGSEKQIAWATDIRFAAFAELDEMCVARTKSLGGLHLDDANFKFLMAVFETETSAKWYIDNRCGIARAIGLAACALKNSAAQ